MSNFINDELTELAHEHASYWTGTLMEKLIDYDLELGDLESLEAHLKESSQLMFEHEYDPDGVSETPNRGFNLDATDVY